MYIREIIDQLKPDVIILQEHWLFQFEEKYLNTIHPQYNYSSRHVDDDDPIPAKQRPRGYGGICILWRKDLSIEKLDEGSSRIQLVKLGESTILVNSYLPCRGKYSNEEFKDEIDQIEEILHKYKDASIIIAGDMNVDIYRQHDARAKYFEEFMMTNEVREVHSTDQATYFHHNKSTKKIDYILVGKKCEENEAVYRLLEDNRNTSPHKALLLKLPHFEIRRADKGFKKHDMKILKWNEIDKELYQETLAQYLDDVEEILNVDASIHLLTTALTAATEIAVPTKTIKMNHKPPPWNPKIKTLLAESKKSHYLWKNAGKPGPENTLFQNRKKINRELRREQRI